MTKAATSPPPDRPWRTVREFYGHAPAIAIPSGITEVSASAWQRDESPCAQRMREQGLDGTSPQILMQRAYRGPNHSDTTRDQPD